MSVLITNQGEKILLTAWVKNLQDQLEEMKSATRIVRFRESVEFHDGEWLEIRQDGCYKMPQDIKIEIQPDPSDKIPE
jgi:hypothetical protein